MKVHEKKTARCEHDDGHGDDVCSGGCCCGLLGYWSLGFVVASVCYAVHACVGIYVHP